MELALVLPLLVLMLFFSLYLTAVVDAKLKLQEATRFAAWEMTSHVLTDYGSGKHDDAFELAAHDTAADASRRFTDIGGAFADDSPVKVFVNNVGVSLRDDPVPGGRGAHGLGAAAANAVGGGSRWVVQQFSFDAKGEVEASASTSVRSRLLPAGTAPVSLKSVFHLVATGWQLEDGADAIMRDGRAGARESGRLPTGLHAQVSRMTFLGVRNELSTMPGLGSVLGFFPKLGVPALTGTFVVSHNYAGDKRSRGCFGARSAASPNPSPDGLNNLQTASALDWRLPRCFDTAPFRDVNSYADSLYVQMFRARGPHFMGCPNAQADDPTAPAASVPNVGDQSQDQVPCG